MNRKVLTILAGIALLVAGTVSAHAASYTFNYNTSTMGTAANSAIQTYMNGVLGAAGSVTLSGAQGDKGYNGDGHVVNGTTLANDEAGVSNDHFIMTLQDNQLDTILMQFSGLTIYSITFDLQIFPDATCTSPCANPPDFTLFTNDGAGGTQKQDYHLYAQNVAAGAKSPASGSGNETAPQLLLDGSNHVTYSSATGFNTIWFQDWPATIGIDNLVINTTKPQVPEPASIMLLGSGLLAVVRRRKK